MSHSKVILSAAAALALVVGAMAAPVFAQGEPDDVGQLIARGQASYVTHCGACHGVEGKGDGAIATYLTVELPDLAQISQRAGGEFPFSDVYDIVDGREVPGHGTRAMPVWGPAFMGLEPESDRKAVKEKIVEVVYYLKSIQRTAMADHPNLGGNSD